MSSDEYDFNVDNYSIDDIFNLFGLDNPTIPQLESAADTIIANAKNDNNEALAILIGDLRDKASQKIKEDTEKTELEEQNTDSPELGCLCSQLTR